MNQDVRLVQHTRKVPFGIRFFQWLGKDRNRLYRGHVLLLTFFTYMTYHLSRKPISIVKGSLNVNCTDRDVHSVLGLFHPRFKKSLSNATNSSVLQMTLTTSCSAWAPFDGPSGKELLGALDLGFLFAYALGMFVSGYVAEHMDLRYFLTVGMFTSGIFTILFGMGFFWKIHSLAYFLTVQIFAGFFQASGWPSVVECVGNWFGKGRRGLIMGIWNSHTSFGNIIGSALAGIWADDKWGYSFIVPGLIIMGMGIIVFLFLIVDPSHVGCNPPKHHIESNKIIAYVNDVEDPETAGLLSSCPEGTYANSESLVVKKSEHGADAEAIGFCKALLIPGVVEYSLCLFFAKLVSYTFLFWLPFYLENTDIGGKTYGPEKSADLSTFFDFGGILGGIFAGVVSDKTNCCGITVVVMLLLGGPMLFIYRFFANSSLSLNIGLMFMSGVLVNGPYALITTAVSANLGTHECLRGDTKAMATVTAIIDGTGSFGAALGPLLTGIISSTGWNNVYYMLISADFFAAVFLSRQVWFELKTIFLSLQNRRASRPFRVSVAESAFHAGVPR
ncbi:glucose-6-phosphate exchanger SLC37A2-like [Actinia tenebrosa]|uniref:Sugar phosphate exchanger 3 n=1 Tax=Actinia tenebrosa TaxID=6105 RepID=A0A6P8IB02_ACTTE|nr:glucose-6-phosphate exchanger SLC37A2-like [Actinia tenebrosa]